VAEGFTPKESACELISSCSNLIMVKQQEQDKTRIYICEACGFGYKEKKLAQKCEDFCKKNNSCSLEITKYAVKK